jgi:hypothetical protein
MEWQTTPATNKKTARVHVMCYQAWGTVVRFRNSFDGA